MINKEIIIIDNLISSVEEVNKKYELIARKTGNNFNIFNILNVQKDEVKHSKFLAELLNCNGIHNQGQIFFILFLELLKKEHSELDNSVIVNCFYHSENKIILEESIGDIDLDESKGGRLDIVIKGENDNIIIIENKVDAKDQHKQLRRYKNNYPNSLLLYLTKFGDNASELSTIDLKNNQDYFCISYKGLITDWIEKCISVVIDKPFLRENLSQYLQIIKSLTNQSHTMEQSKDIINKLLASKENFTAARLIYGEFENAQYALLKCFWLDVKEQIESKFEKVSVYFTKPDDFVTDVISALFIKTSEGRIIGIEPLNGKHQQKRFSNLFVGIFGNSITDKTGPFDEWSNVEFIGNSYNFSDVEFLQKILPNSLERRNIILSIIAKVEKLINK
jgi:hypothetical protein